MRVYLLWLFACTAFACGTESDFGIMIDAGSGGSRVYIYQWPRAFTGQRQFIEPRTRSNWTKSVVPGISEFASRLSELEENLLPLLTFAKRCILETGAPASRLSQFPIYLKATAGVRLLRPWHREPLLSEVRRILLNSEFTFTATNARCISGEEEGINGWLSVNMQRKSIFEPLARIGVLDLGGASLEITFVPSNDVIADFFPLRLKGDTIGLYTHSFLGFGAHLAFDRLLSSEAQAIAVCLARGYTLRHVQGAGNFTQCADLARDRLLLKRAPCWTPSSCSIAGEYQPWVSTTPFQCIGHFSQTVLDILQLSEDASLVDIRASGTVLCNLTVFELATRFPDIMDVDQLGRLCFEAAWVYAVLHDGFEFTEESSQLLFRKANVGMLGAMVYEANTLPWVAPPEPKIELMSWAQVWILIGISLSLVAASVTAVAIVFVLLRNRYRRMTESLMQQRARMYT